MDWRLMIAELWATLGRHPNIATVTAIQGARFSHSPERYESSGTIPSQARQHDEKHDEEHDEGGSTHAYR